MASDLAPATAVLVSGIAFILIADVVLMARDLKPVTHTLRTPAGKIFMIALGGHIIDILGPVDPFRALAGLAGVYKRRFPRRN